MNVTLPATTNAFQAADIFARLDQAERRANHHCCVAYQAPLSSPLAGIARKVRHRLHPRRSPWRRPPTSTGMPGPVSADVADVQIARRVAANSLPSNRLRRGAETYCSARNAAESAARRSRV